MPLSFMRPVQSKISILREDITISLSALMVVKYQQNLGVKELLKLAALTQTTKTAHKLFFKKYQFVTFSLNLCPLDIC